MNIKKIVVSILSSTRLMGILLLVFATSVGIATFIENDYGRMTSKSLIYNTVWFESIILLFTINLVLNIIKYRLFRKEKIAQLTFHISFIVIIAGAAITRYIGFEGIMHIREGESSNTIVSEESFINLEITEDEKEVYKTEKTVYLSQRGNNSYSKSVDINDNDVDIELAMYIPAAAKELEEMTTGGNEYISIVVSSGTGRKDIFIKKGERFSVGKHIISFVEGVENINPTDISIFYSENSMKVNIPYDFGTMRMQTQEFTKHKAQLTDLQNSTLYSLDKVFFVFRSYTPHGRLLWKSIPIDKREKGFSYTDLLTFNVNFNGNAKELVVFGQSGMIGKKSSLVIDGYKISMSYGSKGINIPFSISLNDFILDKYPGSSSPSSFESYITLTDNQNNLKVDKKIFMNNVMDYQGFRFFQSSYDKDEKGTVLSVNHDYWGTFVTYLGYFFLALGMIVSLFTKKGSIRTVGKKLEQLRKKHAQSTNILLTILAISFTQNAFSSNSLLDKVVDGKENVSKKIDVNDSESDANLSIEQEAKKVLPNPDNHIVSILFANHIEKILLQDFSGRIKPYNTQATDIIHKIAKLDKIQSWTASQIMTGMLLFPKEFITLPIVKVNHKEVSKILGITGKHASFADFWDKKSGQYILSDYVESALQKKPSERGKFDKELIHVDERFNICYTIFSGDSFRVIPDSKSMNNRWLTPHEYMEKKGDDRTKIPDIEKFLFDFVRDFTPAVEQSLKSSDWSIPTKMIDQLISKQREIDGDICPSENKIAAELFYNKVKIFAHLVGYYLLLGLLMVCLYVISVIYPKIKGLHKAMQWLSYFVILGFISHTCGLALRWYITGHAPWTDGYESLVYISWASLLAGVFFYKRYPIIIGFTGIFGGLGLWVATLTLFDPQITPLVPVLKSYWLTIHVSMITASYGFFGLGAVIALFNLILLLLKSADSELKRVVKELTMLIEINLTLGLMLLTIGTFLGGVWANESWGRYWGWDPKESWAFVSILVYAFVLHVKFIPKMRGDLVFNVLSVFSFFSILMTYFGVNFFLSGLHSYAAGDPIPIPTWVYTAVSVLVGLVSAVIIKNYFAKKIN